MHRTDSPAVTGCAIQWQNQINSDGSPVKLIEIAEPLQGVTKQASFLGALASGCQPNAGMDVIRLDLKDYPYIYNVDHYRVIESLPRHPDYQTLLQYARVDDSEALREVLDSWIFLVGPEKTADHWRRDLPDFWQKLLNLNLPKLNQSKP